MQQQRLSLRSLQENRLLLAKQAALVLEAGALDSAFGSHPLSTLAHRYSDYKLKKDEYDNCHRALLDRLSTCNKQMTDYHNCLHLIETNKISQHLSQLNELMTSLNAVQPNHAFELVKDFLDNSAQTPIYLQSCQLNSGLDVLVKKQIVTVQQTLKTLNEYGSITRYHPPSEHRDHRFTKYAEWCKCLIEHSPVQNSHDIVAQIKAKIGKNTINEVDVEQVITFSYSVQQILRDSELRLQKTLDRMVFETENNMVDCNATESIIQYTNLFEDARNSIRIFIQDQDSLSTVTVATASEKKYNLLALHCVTISILCDLNKRLLQMENASANTAGNMVDLTFYGNWVLDEFYAHSAVMCEMTSIIEKAHRDHGTKTLTESFFCATRCLRQIQNVHQHLREFNEQISSSILSDTLYGTMSEKENVIDMMEEVSCINMSLPENLMENLCLQLRHGSNAEAQTRQALIDVAKVRQNFDALKKQMEQQTDEFGSKLFLRINGLFEKLDVEYDRLIDCLQDLNLKGDQRKIDQIKSSIQLAVSGIAEL